MKTKILAVMAVIAAGCAVVETGDQRWFKPGATQAEQNAALSSAQIQAKQAHVAPSEERGIFLEAMTAQGWRLMPKGAAPKLATQPASPAKPPPRAHANML